MNDKHEPTHFIMSEKQIAKYKLLMSDKPNQTVAIGTHVWKRGEDGVIYIDEMVRQKTYSPLEEMTKDITEALLGDGHSVFGGTNPNNSKENGKVELKKEE